MYDAVVVRHLESRVARLYHTKKKAKQILIKKGKLGILVFNKNRGDKIIIKLNNNISSIRTAIQSTVITVTIPSILLYNISIRRELNGNATK